MTEKLSQFTKETPTLTSYVAGANAGSPNQKYLLSDIQTIVTRQPLTANANYYVSTAGRDTNDGLNAGSPWRTIQHAINFVSQVIFLNGFQVTINVADGTYNEYLFCNDYPSSFPTGAIFADAPIHVNGNLTDSTKVKIVPSIPFPGVVVEFGVINTTGPGAVYYFDSITIDATQCPGPDCDCIFALNGSRAFYADCIWAGAKGQGVLWDLGSTAVVELSSLRTAQQIITGGSNYYGLAFVIEGSLLSIFNNTILNFAVDPNCQTAVLDIEFDSCFSNIFGAITQSGTCTGKKFICTDSSTINWVSNPINHTSTVDVIPGTAPGTINLSGRVNGNINQMPVVVANTTSTILQGCRIEGITIENTTANAVTGGIRIGTTGGANDVVTAQAVGANALLTIADANILKHVFSTSAAQTLFIEAVVAWNNASLNISIEFAPAII